MKNRLTRGNLLATLKELKKHPRPKVANPVPASVQAIVRVSNPQPKKSKELARAIAQRRAILSGGTNRVYHLTASELALLERLTTLHDFRMPYKGEQYGELFIHWFYRDRSVDRLSRCEIFHLNMLQYFNVLDRVEVIHIRCAARIGMTEAMKKAIEILSSGKAKVDFKIISQEGSWEHDTFKESVEYSVDTGKFIYYTHFKGASRIGDAVLGLDSRSCRNSTDLDIFYWCYLMYRGMFEAPVGVKSIGPLPYMGMNKSFRVKDISWSQLGNTPYAYFYCGSFQAFSGEYLKGCFGSLQLSTSEDREHKLWGDKDPYTVEMFLSLITRREDTYSLPISFSETRDIYHVYSSRHIRLYMGDFIKLFLVNDMSSWEADYFRFMESELEQMGC